MRDIQQQSEPVILRKLAHLLGTEVKNNRLDIPAEYGSGYCSGFVFNAHIRMFVFHYELNENVVVDNEGKDAVPMLLFKFQHIIPDIGLSPAEKQQVMPSVLITTSSLHTDTAVPIHSNKATINIEVDPNYLRGLFDNSVQSPVLQSLLQNTQPLLFEQMVQPSLQKIVDEMLAAGVEDTFKLFFLRIKAEELICRLLMELEKRDEQQLYALNGRDVAMMYKVKEQLLAQLDTPPVIKELALSAGMSPTKLKRLFKQIFGDSIFSYYQAFRMREAAILLKDEKLSVSDVGYQLGFTNLSHFSRVFQEHMGMKPKQYSRS
ncbi:helix-turn-helix domain-containing protein [Chitinophaga pinensis]|uniref:Transcriptional regulator, AraC family n=1 Tax=Chitinophaga pinensis (strain ATCC 43595 / DSM 2588 / LMG 13176 / NBRC 15968 / NCIMB 11800 / UQM 2034) TaxID=485918 RepID=A0A979G9D0_CHIPD|nr:AraC family transcriptional regulator [Chitinophaga pinensis]ACU63115.1 transcriptional regulator, AraC family [Chitinophaga pinensis DSM 2588]